MEFIPRGGDRNTPQTAHSASNPAHTPVHAGRRKHIDWAARTVRIELFILLTGVALLLVFLSLYLWSSSNAARSEFDRVDNSKYQAVFLNGGATGGQVEYSTYFGQITKLNDKYVVLRDIYYLTTQQGESSQDANNVQLTKLGCQQLHSPFDEMVINRSQVAFWENLKDDGKVVQAIKEYQKQNPSGPNCDAQTQPNTQNPAPSTQNPTTPNDNNDTNP